MRQPSNGQAEGRVRGLQPPAVPFTARHASPGDVNLVVSLPGRGNAYDGHKLVAPVDLSGQVRLPRHEGVTKLCRPLECHNDLRIDLQVTHKRKHS